MSISAFLVTAFIETLSPGPRIVACTFPAPTPGEHAISLAVEARPSLLDRADRFRVRVHIDHDSAHEVGGLVQPIDRTEERDVLIRARAANETYYTVGLRDDGLAALNLLRTSDGEQEAERLETRRGACQDFKAALDSWLKS